MSVPANLLRIRSFEIGNVEFEKGYNFVLKLIWF